MPCPCRTCPPMCSMSLTVVVRERWKSVDAARHLVRRQARVLPDDRDHGDADFRGKDCRPGYARRQRAANQDRNARTTNVKAASERPEPKPASGRISHPTECRWRPINACKRSEHDGLSETGLPCFLHGPRAVLAWKLHPMSGEGARIRPITRRRRSCASRRILSLIAVVAASAPCPERPRPPAVGAVSFFAG